jgi:DNA polymerase phi
LERRDPVSDEEEDDDIEMVDLSDENDDEKGDEDNDESDNESSEEEDDDELEDDEADLNDEEALALRTKIEQALRVNGIEPATDDDDSEEEELLDDEQMMAIDEQLAEVFRSRTNEKKSGKREFSSSKSLPIALTNWSKQTMPSAKLHISRSVCLTLSTPMSRNHPPVFSF